MKHVPNYPWYMVSENGEVYHVKYKKKRKLKPYTNGIYLRVKIGGKHIYIHRLVAMLYKPHPKMVKLQVHHEDHDPTNNQANNLRWVTVFENNRLKSERKNSQNVVDCPF